MDWSNEFYIRIYTRDTTTWRLLGWDGQNVLMQLTRKVDRAGTLELDGIEPWEAIVLHCNAPEESARAGMAKLLKHEVVKVRNDTLVIPNFMAAQEASKSDKVRAKESRQRKALGLEKLHHPTRESQNVTAPSQVVTPESQAVATHHDASRGDTPRHSSLRSSLHSAELHSASLRDASLRAEGARGTEQELPRVAADLVPDNPDQADPESALDQRGREFGDARKLVRLEFSRRWERAGQKGMWTQGGSPAVDTIANWALSLGPAEREAALLKALENFFADPFCRSIHFAVSHLAKDPGKYFEPRERPSQAPESVESLRAQSVSAVIAGDLAKVQALNARIEEITNAATQNGGRRARA